MFSLVVLFNLIIKQFPQGTNFKLFCDILSSESIDDYLTATQPQLEGDKMRLAHLEMCTGSMHDAVCLPVRVLLSNACVDSHATLTVFVKNWCFLPLDMTTYDTNLQVQSRLVRYSFPP